MAMESTHKVYIDWLLEGCQWFIQPSIRKFRNQRHFGEVGKVVLAIHLTECSRVLISKRQVWDRFKFKFQLNDRAVEGVFNQYFTERGIVNASCRKYTINRKYPIDDSFQIEGAPL